MVSRVHPIPDSVSDFPPKPIKSSIPRGSVNFFQTCLRRIKHWLGHRLAASNHCKDRIRIQSVTMPKVEVDWAGHPIWLTQSFALYSYSATNLINPLKSSVRCVSELDDAHSQKQIFFIVDSSWRVECALYSNVSWSALLPIRSSTLATTFPTLATGYSTATSPRELSDLPTITFKL